MLKYVLGLLKNLFNPAVSLFSIIDDKSVVCRKAKVYGNTQVTNSTIGDYSYVGRKTRVIYADIGKFCSISGSVQSGMGTHTLDLDWEPLTYTKKEYLPKYIPTRPA